VATRILIGTYVIVHDDGQGGPCTALYRVGTGPLPLEETVAFHCTPFKRKAAPRFTTTVDWNPALGMDMLIEYQFAGDSEGHGVPVVKRIADRMRRPVSSVCLR
jgi:hypothetical protein